MTTATHESQRHLRPVRDEPAESAPADETEAQTLVAVDSPGSGEPPAAASAWRPVVPSVLSSRANLNYAVTHAAHYTGHTLAYHGLRAPAYVGKLAARSPRGAGRIVAATARWALDAEDDPLRKEARRRLDSREYHKLARHRDARVRLRLAVTAAAATLLLLVLGAVWVLIHPTFAVAAVIVGLGVAGAPQDKPLMETATVNNRPPRLTSASIVTALSSLGIGELNKSAKQGEGVAFTGPIKRDGPGYRADLDLPPGVTAAHVMEKRAELASGLRRPVGAVWPEPDHEQHAGRLVLWVGDQDMNKARQPAWPLDKASRFNLFDPIPFGADQRQRPVELPLMYSNLLAGSLPGAGKSMAVRIPNLAAALDVTAELRIYELKGTGDMSPLEPVAHHYGSGPDDATIESCMASLREVHKDLERRAKTISKLPRSQCPENKVTRDLAARKDLRLHPVVFTIDECQELFLHPDYGKEAVRLATAIIKRGRALAVILILATQRPDKESLPNAISDNVGVRFCLRVMGQVANDQILGTSMYKTGVRATAFTVKDLGIGWIVGASPDPKLARTYYKDAHAADKVVTRARAAREAAGTLSGHALDEDTDQPPTHDLLDDVASVFRAGEQRLWSETVVARLAELRPETYGKWEAAQLVSGLKPYGVSTSKQIWGRDGDGEERTRRGVLAEHITRAVTERDQMRGGDAS